MTNLPARNSRGASASVGAHLCDPAQLARVSVPTRHASAPADDFMHAHKWKRGVREDVATVKEIRRKASKIAPAYNKGALQYLPDEKDS